MTPKARAQEALENPFSVEGTISRYSSDEKSINGIAKWDRVVQIDAPRIHGTVAHCADDGVVIRWDDGTVGEMMWANGVFYNAYRLQTVALEKHAAAVKRGEG